MSEENIPRSKGHIATTVIDFLRKQFDDPVVEITEIKANLISIRIGQGDRGPRYFEIKISEKV